MKLESNKYPVTTAAHGTVVDVRYDPFDLSEVFVFKNNSLVETTAVSKLVNRTAAVPVESSAPASQVSAHSAQYFQALREQHAEILRQNLSPVSYAKLTPKKEKP